MRATTVRTGSTTILLLFFIFLHLAFCFTSTQCSFGRSRKHHLLILTPCCIPFFTSSPSFGYLCCVTSSNHFSRLTYLTDCCLRHQPSRSNLTAERKSFDFRGIDISPSSDPTNLCTSCIPLSSHGCLRSFGPQTRPLYNHPCRNNL